MSHPVALAIGLYIRDMKRTFGSWPQLTDAEFRRLMREVAYTVASCEERDVAELMAQVPERVAKGGDLRDLCEEGR